MKKLLFVTVSLIVFFIKEAAAQNSYYRTPNQVEISEQSSDVVKTETSYKKFYRSPFTLGLETASWQYQEVVDNKQLMAEKGRLNGIRLGLDTAAGDSLYAGGHLSFLTGKTNYDGQISDGKTSSPYQSKSENNILEIEGLVGFNTSLSEGTILTPNIGLSYWYLINPEQKEDPYDYSRLIRYRSVPIGASVKTFLGESSLFTFGAQYYYFLGGEARSYLAQEGVGSDITNKQNGGSGQKFTATYAYDGQSLTYGVSLYYRTWKIDKSESVFSSEKTAKEIVTYETYEPANNTKMLGLNLFLGF